MFILQVRDLGIELDPLIGLKAEHEPVPALARRPSIGCGHRRNATTISVRRSQSRLPVRRKKGTPDQRQLSTRAPRATKVSVSCRIDALFLQIPGDGHPVDGPRLSALARSAPPRP